MEKLTDLETCVSSPEVPTWHPAFVLEARAVALHAVGPSRDPAIMFESDDALCTSLQGLLPGERIVLTYTGGGGRDLGFILAGETASHSVSVPAARDEMAARVMASLLPLNKCIQLVPKHEAHGLGFPLQALDAPGLWTTLPTPMGFRAGRPAVADGVWLPAWSAGPPAGLAALNHLFWGGHHETALRIVIDRMDLDEDTRRALAHLAARPTRHIRHPTAPAISESAALWAAAPSGLRLRAWAGGAKGLDPGARNALRAMLFGGAPIQCDRVPAGKVLADLRGWIPWGKPLPRLLPTPADLLGGAKRRVFTPTPQRPANVGVRLGQTHDTGHALPVRIAPEARCRHVYAIGATGTGKSTLLAHMIRQDIANGEGVCVVDPHGDLVNQVLQTYPEARAQDLVLIEAGDPRRAAGFNLLECGPGARDTQINFAVSEFLGIFRALYLAETMGPVFELYLRNALLLLMDNPLPPHTLMDLPRVFEDRAFRNALLTWCRNPWVRDFWQKSAEHTSGDHSLANITAYVVSKMNNFLYSPALRAMIGQPRSTINFDRVLARQQVLLLNLAKGGLGELDTRLLGMTLLSRLFGATLSRGTRTPGQRRPFQLYVDEFHQFHTSSFSTMLSESRKFGLGVTIAHQNLCQIARSSGSNDLLEAVLGNVSTLLLFRVGAPDATRLATYTQPEVSAQTLQYLPDHHVVARLLDEGRPTRPFVFETDPPSEMQAPAHLAHTLRLSRRRHTRPRAQVDSAMALHHARPLEPQASRQFKTLHEAAQATTTEASARLTSQKKYRTTP